MSSDCNELLRDESDCSWHDLKLPEVHKIPSNDSLHSYTLHSSASYRSIPHWPLQTVARCMVKRTSRTVRLLKRRKKRHVKCSTAQRQQSTGTYHKYHVMSRVGRVSACSVHVIFRGSARTALHPPAQTQPRSTRSDWHAAASSASKLFWMRDLILIPDRQAYEDRAKAKDLVSLVSRLQHTPITTARRLSGSF